MALNFAVAPAAGTSELILIAGVHKQTNKRIVQSAGKYLYVHERGTDIYIYSGVCHKEYYYIYFVSSFKYNIISYK